MTMDRFDCNGRLRITMVDGDSKVAGIKITHYRPHCQYVDISLTDKVDAIIQSMTDMPASKVSLGKIFSVIELKYTLRHGIQFSHKRSRDN